MDKDAKVIDIESLNLNTAFNIKNLGLGVNMNTNEKFIQLTQKTISTKYDEMEDGTILPVNPWTIGIGLSGNKGDTEKKNHVAALRLINSESQFHIELTSYLNPENDYKGDAEVITISCFGEDESKRLLEALETAVFLLKSKLQEKEYGQHEMAGSGFSEIKVQL
ncbi:MAG: hypothetical protein RBS43_10650 [Candidatus Cloacimonas sp.]|jgi:hypothetical protein|nr:hypothetical protein [Candidatus Cloacimonas sp.]